MTQSLYKFTVWISQLAILNLLWLGFSLRRLLNLFLCIAPQHLSHLIKN